MEKLTGRLNEILVDWKSGDRPGIAISVRYQNETVFCKSYGLAAIEYGIPVTEATSFYLCSLSKQFTAFCLGDLIYAGRVSIDDKLTSFFPELPEDVYGDVTVNHLVHQCSGIHEWYDMLEYSGSYNDEYPWRKMLLPLLARQEYLNFTPGEKHLYSNTNYVLITLIIEQITHKSLAEYARELIFGPLGMKSTFYNEDNNQIIKNSAMGYYKVSGNYKRADVLPPLIGAGGINSTLADMEIWLKTLIKRQWRSDIIDIMLSSASFNNGDNNEYLFGFIASEINGRKVFRHGGAVPGFFTSIWFFPEENTGFFWLANSSSFKPHILNNQIIQVLEEELFQQKSVPVKAPALDLNEFAGNYIDIAADTGAKFSVIEDKLQLSGSDSTFDHARDLVFKCDAGKPDYLIFEKYYGLTILRHISADSDRFLVKADILPSNENIADYQGRFHSNELDVTYCLTLKDNKLFIDTVKKFRGADLRMISQDIFLSPSKDIKLRFLRDDQNKIITMMLDSSRSQNFTFQRVLMD